MSAARSRRWFPAHPRAGDASPRIATSLLRVAAVATMVLTASGCLSTRLNRDAARVRVIAAGEAPAGCTRAGDIEVTVDTGLGPLQRDPLAVQDQLETLARNRAPGLGATDLQPLAPPPDGSQRFRAWRCPGR